MKFNLEKESARVKFVLEKRNLPEMRASVGFTLDVSGSTENLYRSGTMQEVVQKIVPVGLRFDDNGSLDAWCFSNDHRIAELSQATVQNYEGFVEREIFRNPNIEKWGGTSYFPIIKLMLEKYGFYDEQPTGKPVGFFKMLFGNGNNATKHTNTLKADSRSGEAVINYFITDGENDDQDPTYRLLKECQDAKVNMYFMFIGVGRARFPFLEKVAEDFGNTGFLNVQDLEKFVNSDDVYEQLLPEELTGWLKQKKA